MATAIDLTNTGRFGTPKILYELIKWNVKKPSAVTRLAQLAAQYNYLTAKSTQPMTSQLMTGHTKKCKSTFFLLVYLLNLLVEPKNLISKTFCRSLFWI